MEGFPEKVAFMLGFEGSVEVTWLRKEVKGNTGGERGIGEEATNESSGGRRLSPIFRDLEAAPVHGMKGANEVVQGY